MSETKHTPGPWYLVADDGTDFTAIATVPEIDGDTDMEHEVLGSSEWLRVNLEDLRLMAAAPELLVALQAVDVLFGHLATDSTQRIWIDNARAAIAKATTGV